MGSIKTPVRQRRVNRDALPKGMQHRILMFDNHVLRGSASTVLTATGLVSGEGQIMTYDRIDTP